MVQIKTFTGKNRLNLEEVVNTWLKNNPSIEVIDVKYSIGEYCHIQYHNTLVVYKVKYNIAIVEDLKCPLEVLFKARNGFYTNVGYISPEHIYNIDIKNQTIEFEWLDDGCWNEDGLVEFENYKSNWWLKEDRSD